MDENSVVEMIASAQHEIWSHWMKYLFSVCAECDDGSMLIPSEKSKRWQRQMYTHYRDLSERERDSDRDQARKVVSALTPFVFTEPWTSLRERAETAEAALEHSKRFCVWSWSAYGAAWFAQCDGLAFADTRWFTHCPRCGRRINFKAKAQP